MLASRNKAMSRWLQSNRKSIIPGIAKLADLARRMQEADSLLRSYGIIPDEASLMQRARDVVELGTSKYGVPHRLENACTTNTYPQTVHCATTADASPTHL